MATETEPRVRLTTGESGKPLVRMFLSFAKRDEAVARRLWDLLDEATAIDRVYEFRLWRADEAILTGEEWDVRIKDALTKSELGILALSNAFLGSKYITDVEVPALVDVPGKRALPLSLRQVGGKADWHTLKNKQIYGHRLPFGRVRGSSAQDAWVNGLVAQLHRVLAEYGTPADGTW
ncbi:TIR domain-containing protein [Amycolatopsis sp., V23-08]|uniref:TIR domain-containing protein n=1 Tax=Amycolatopsis heterodermiae TaxID=3110235 RepID=A0ABU5QYY8_9PSEU|nr:TIR domain-containing protein [Amycolatopsis sp., V23-08]MEA5359160.1 TIR domain-containing protein [Amycolatopsis sp., V23-08]